MEPFPLTDGQLAAWMAQAGEGPGTGFHYLEWEAADLDPQRFGRAWNRLVERHEALRTVVRADGLQETLPHTARQVPLLDLRDRRRKEAEREALAERERLCRPTVASGGRKTPFEVRVTLLPDGPVRLHLMLDRRVCDSWRLAHVLLTDLAALYADPDGDPDRPATSYRRRVLDALAGENSAEFQRARRYWLDRLAGLPPPPDLPAAPPSRSARMPRPHRWSFRLGAAQWSLLRDRALRRDIPPSAVLAAAFAEVLRTWSRSDRFTLARSLFETPPAGAAGPGPAGDFGLVVPLAVAEPTGTFTDRARALAARMAEDHEHRHFDGVRLLRVLNRGRAAGERARFPVVFTDLTDRPWPNVFGSLRHALSPAAGVSLELETWADDTGLEVRWNTREDLFPPGMPADMAGAYRQMLRELAADEAAWSQAWFALVPPAQLAERARVNDTAAPLPDGLLHTALAVHARRRPDAPAVITSARTLTYRETSVRVNQVGRRLRELGARPGRLVAVVMEKGWEQIVAAYGVLAAGAAYLPLDPAVPAERLHRLLAYGQVGMVLTQRRLESSLPWPDGVRRLCVDTDFEGVDGTDLEPLQQPTDLAYVIFTSGSTGTPKGVMVDHRGPLNTILDVNRRFNVGPGDRCIAVSGLHFDLSVYDVFGMIAAGGAVVVPDPCPAPDPAHWSDLMRRHGVTFWNSVPALLEMLVTYLELDGGPDRIAALRLAILAGDWIPVTLPDRVRALGPQIDVIGSGGPAETCVWSVIYPIGRVDPAWTSIPYGRPMANQRYHVLDRRRRPCPVWVPGEIYISSEVGLAKGYWRDEERTARQFVTLPESGARAYASGDIGRYLPGGDIEILGREDFQVKIQGIRIELGEIETVLAEHPGVRAAVVVASRAVRDLPVLHAYAACGEAAQVTPAGLRAFLARRLPAAMVPSVITVLDRLPLTANGKVDRLALSRHAAPGRDRVGDAFVAPDTPARRRFCAVCAEVLGVPRVGMRDDFFRLGGDSRSAVALAARLRTEFQAEVTAPAVFATPVVGELCAAVLGHEATVAR